MSDWYEPDLNIRYDPTMTAVQRIEMIKGYAEQYPNHRTFVETGTADGATPLAVWTYFDSTYTIEVSRELYEMYSPMLQKASRTITPILGDSMHVLPSVLSNIEEAIFWLDGHFCGGARGTKDTPVAEEIEMILATGKPHLILVDDARLFGRDPSYPTLEWVRHISTTQDVPYEFSYKDDVMRLIPLEV